MNVAAPQSGASGLPHVFDNETVSRERVAAAGVHVVDSMTHAVMNSILEVGDDLVLPAIVKSIENRAYRLKAARHIQDEAVHEKYMDELGPFAKELLAAPAHEREQMIGAKDLELYARELERMERLDWEKLDEAHKQYLEELELANHYVRYWREDSDITQITQARN